MDNKNINLKDSRFQNVNTEKAWMTITKNDKEKLINKKYDNVLTSPRSNKNCVTLDSNTPIGKYWDGFNEEGERWFIEFEDGMIINQKHPDFEYFFPKI